MPGPSNGPSGLTVQESGGEADIIGLPAVEVMVAYDDEAFAFYGDDIDTVRANAAAMVNLTNAIYRNTDQQQHMNRPTSSPPTPRRTPTTSSPTATSSHPSPMAISTGSMYRAILEALTSSSCCRIGLSTPKDSVEVAFFPVGASPAEDNAYNVTEAAALCSASLFPTSWVTTSAPGHDLDTPNACGYTDGTGHVDAGRGQADGDGPQLQHML